MKVVIATDSWKGSLTSLEAGQAIADGLRRANPDAQLCVRPLADGGEGTMEALVDAMSGDLHSIKVTGPLGEPVQGTYGIVQKAGTIRTHSDERVAGNVNDAVRMEENTKTVPGEMGEVYAVKTGVIEIASAAGLTLVPVEKRNPLLATSYGVGELIKDAIAQGCRHFIVGIGGSAVNDGGIGMLQALGFGFLNKNRQQVSFGAQGLSELASITMDHVIPELSECTFRVACDVTNPLCGEAGASMVYGLQKGATPEMAQKMDAWMAAYAKLVKRYLSGFDLTNQASKSETGNHVDSNYPGSGAAGGLGFAFRTFLHAELESGVRIILEETHLEDYIRDADLVVTGEGHLDAQTVMGKAPIGVAQLAKKYGKRVIAFCGCASDDAKMCNGAGIDAYFPAVRGPQTLEEAMLPEVAAENIKEASEQVMRFIASISHPLC